MTNFRPALLAALLLPLLGGLVAAQVRSNDTFATQPSAPVLPEAPQKPKVAETQELPPLPSNKTIKPQPSDVVEPADLPAVRVVIPKRTPVKIVESALEKLFDTQIESGELKFTVGHTSNRLVVRSSDELWKRIIELVDLLDVSAETPLPGDAMSNAQSQKTPSSSPPLSGEQNALLRLLREIKNPDNDASTVQSLRQSLASNVERDFVAQQNELRAELTKLRERMDSLAALLEKREAHKTQICQKRIDALLSAETESEFSDPARRNFQDPSTSQNSKPTAGKANDRLDSPADAGWQHSYGGSQEVDAYFRDLAEYIKSNPKSSKLLHLIIINKASDEAIRAGVGPRKQELSKHLAAQDALSSNGSENKLAESLLNALGIIENEGRRQLETRLANDQDPTLSSFENYGNPLAASANPTWKPQRRTPLRSNISLSGDGIDEEITTILQAELTGEAGMQVILKGKPASLTTSLLFQIDNRSGRVEYELWSGEEKRITARIQLECQEAGQGFWERLYLTKILLNITQEEFNRVAFGQLVTKAVYLPQEAIKGPTTLVSYEEEPGTDVRQKAKQLGMPIVTMVLSNQSEPDANTIKK